MGVLRFYAGQQIPRYQPHQSIGTWRFWRPVVFFSTNCGSRCSWSNFEGLSLATVVEYLFVWPIGFCNTVVSWSTTIKLDACQIKGVFPLMLSAMNVLFIDADNLSSPAWVEEACQILESTEGAVAVRRAYGSAENLKGLSDVLKAWAIRPFVNLSLSKNTTDMALAIDAMELACQTPHPKMVAIGSGDADFVPLVVRLRERGIRVVCISERGKMASEAVRAYDQIVYVGSAPAPRKNTPKAPAVVKPEKGEVPPQSAKPAAKKPAKKVVPTPVQEGSAPLAKKSPKKEVVKNDAAMKDAVKTVTVEDILSRVPNLQSGQWLALNDVSNVLHKELLIGKNASSSKLFKRFAQHFELDPVKQPHRVRFTQVA